MEANLITKDSKGKIRVVEISCKWEDTKRGYVIRRNTYQLGGKITLQPEIWIFQGQASRTISEQSTLEFNSHIKKYKDKGYKELNVPISNYTTEELNALVGDIKTDASGVIKPMLAKQADKVSTKAFDKDYYASRKINGVRCLIYYKDGEIKTSSRGAINYDLAIFHIIDHPVLKEFFKNHPEVILDGEIYKHGWTLNKISGLCRTQSTIEDGKDLQFYWYDIVDLKEPFSERYKTIQDYSKELQLSEFDPYKCFLESELAIQKVEHQEISGWSAIKKLHDSYVADGWEGLVIRLSNSVYKPGSRGSEWIKVKEYIEEEYPIKGIAEGLREEDMCFILETSSGQRFKCKPMGDRAQKQWYREHIEELIDLPLTIKYFEMSGVEGSEVPQQPVGVAIRNYE